MIANEANITPREQFEVQGWFLSEPLTVTEIRQLQSWVDEISAWPDESNAWLHYRELTDNGPVLCRSENFTPYHSAIKTFLTQGKMLATAGELLAEPAVLYKEKINYKLVGGAGYSPHQDALAYRFVDVHISCMVAVDDASIDNGCLEVVSGLHGEILPTDDKGCIRPEVVEDLEWTAVELKAGQTLWFHSRTPHRSGPNNSDQSRRALYPTYNSAREGDLREDYYQQKQAEFDVLDQPEEQVPVSLIGDFQGRPVK